MDIEKPRNVKVEEWQGTKITRWAIGPEAEISFLLSPLYLPVEAFDALIKGGRL